MAIVTNCYYHLYRTVGLPCTNSIYEMRGSFYSYSLCPLTSSNDLTELPVCGSDTILGRAIKFMKRILEVNMSFKCFLNGLV